MIYEGSIIIGGYLLGAIPFALWIPRLYGVPDIRKVGSGNVGATNVIRACGISGGLIVTFFDIAKGAVPVLLSGYLYHESFILPQVYLQLAVGFAAILGHIFPLYLGFKGGKGVNTALGVFLVLIPIPTLAALLAFILVVTISRYVSLGSIIASAVFFAMILIFYLAESIHLEQIFVPTGLAILILILVTHRSNIKRLFSGNENRFSFSRSEKEGESNA